MFACVKELICKCRTVKALKCKLKRALATPWNIAVETVFLLVVSFVAKLVNICMQSKGCALEARTQCFSFGPKTFSCSHEAKFASATYIFCATGLIGKHLLPQECFCNNVSQFNQVMYANKRLIIFECVGWCDWAIWHLCSTQEIS